MEMLQGRVRELEAEAEAGRQQLAEAAQQLAEQGAALECVAAAAAAAVHCACILQRSNSSQIRFCHACCCWATLRARRAAQGEVEELASAKAQLEASLEASGAAKDKLVPQLEQARWQNRQLEKRLEDAAAAKAAAKQVR